MQLRKNQKLSLRKHNTTYKKIVVTVRWKENVTRKKFDVDLSSFGLTNNNRAVESHVLYFNQVESADNAIIHSGDERESGSETITFDLAALAAKTPRVQKNALWLTIDRAVERGQKFSQLISASLSIECGDTGEVIQQYDLGQFPEAISIELGFISKNADGGWEFEEMGVGYPDKEFVDIAVAYGVEDDGT